MKRLVIESWLLLLYFEFVLLFCSFKVLHETVRREKVRPASEPILSPNPELCRAMDLACVFYIKRVLCLQRSAATTLLMRRHGWEAEMVIGAQILPFKSHAWVELRGTVVNDKPYVSQIYAVLERC
jgi:hypothetical protein